MTAKILDGRRTAAAVRERLKERVAAMPEKPGLAAILVGNNPASRVYVGIKRKTCEEVGIHSELHALPEETTDGALCALIERLNRDRKIHGILLQLPLPKHMNEERALAAIAREKDVDGFHAENLGGLVRGVERVVPCTPKGIIRLLEAHGILLEGKRVVVVGRSATVGRPLALMCLNRNATVTICHSRTADLAEQTRRADILVVAAGRPKMVTADMVKAGAVVVDVGINRTESGITGDVDFERVKEKAAWITPVPGGVGPMTVAMLMENTVSGAAQ